jgi:hypothetical protein
MGRIQNKFLRQFLKDTRVQKKKTSPAHKKGGGDSLKISVSKRGISKCDPIEVLV